jgi:hypothetical protein
MVGMKPSRSHKVPLKRTVIHWLMFCIYVHNFLSHICLCSTSCSLLFPFSIAELHQPHFSHLLKIVCSPIPGKAINILTSLLQLQHFGFIFNYSNQIFSSLTQHVVLFAGTWLEIFSSSKT